MNRILDIFWRVTFTLGVGAILVAFSEVLFYQVPDDVDMIALWLLYSLMVSPFLSVFTRADFVLSPSTVLAGASFGFLAEGLLVSELFLYLPFTLLWTSLAWHLSVSVALGLCVFAKSILEGRTGRSLIKTSLLGAYLGAWNSYMWAVRAVPDNADVSFDWSRTGGFVEQLPEGVAFLGIGMLLMFFSKQQFSDDYGIVEKIGLGAIVTIFAVGQLPINFPFSLILPFMLLLNMKADSVRRNDKAFCQLAAQRDFVSFLPFLKSLVLHCSVLTLWTLGIYLLLSTYRIGIEMNVIHILAFGPYGLYLWGKALMSSFRGALG
ncbi:MAG: hypothetical protein AAF716_04795 [Cyanobacteria bacterium P01_D01_bin.1]